MISQRMVNWAKGQAKNDWEDIISDATVKILMRRSKGLETDEGLVWRILRHLVVDRRRSSNLLNESLVVDPVGRIEAEDSREECEGLLVLAGDYRDSLVRWMNGEDERAGRNAIHRGLERIREKV